MSLSRLSIAAAALALSALFASPAIARDRVFVADLQAPVAERVQLIANSSIWVCEGARCTARAASTASVSGCRDLARRVGPVNSYGTATAPFTPERLAACNEAAPAPAPTSIAATGEAAAQ